MKVNIEDMTMLEYEEMIRGQGSQELDRLSIEAMSMLEYEEMMRGRNSSGLDRLLVTVKDRPRLDRLSIEEMTMNEYFEMMRGRDGPGLDRQSSASEDRQGPPEFYVEDSTYTLFPEKNVHFEETTNGITSQSNPLVEPTPNQFHESGKFVNLNSFVFTNAVVEIAQEIIDESWFDAFLLEDAEDIGSKTNQVLEEGECLMLKIPCSMEIFDSENDFKELEDLLEDSNVILPHESSGNAKKILNSEPIRSMPIIGHTPYSIIALERDDIHELLFATFQDVCDEERNNFDLRHEDLLLRETREWKDAWVKYCNELTQSNEALFLDDCFKDG